MNDETRRTVLKGALASSAAVIGIGGTAAAFPPNSNGQEDDDDDGNGPGGGSGQQPECEPPNELLAKLEWDEDEGEFIFEKPEGNEGLVEITYVELDEDGEPIAFCWKSDVPVCFIAVKAGQEIREFQGDVRSGCVDLEGDTDVGFAISNIIFCVRPAQAVLCDVAIDGFDVETTLDGDPDPTGDRTGVVHVTSEGDTQDYASGTVNVANDQPGLTLGAFDDPGGSALRYDFFEGSGNTNATPDEAFVIFQTPDQRDDVPTNLNEEGPDEFNVAYRVSNQDTPVGAWQERDVDDELNGTLPADQVSERAWKVLTVESDDILTATGIITTAASLRDSPPDFDDLVANYPDSVVLGAGYGFGDTKDPETLDAYFDSLDVADTTYDFPVAVPLEVTDASSSDGETTVTMELVGQEGVSASDVVESSVTLTGLLQVAPAPQTDEQGGTTASSVSVSGNEITATFETSTSGEFLVSGDFDVDRDQIVSFLAEGSI